MASLLQLQLSCLLIGPLRNVDVRECLPGELNMSFHVLADDGLLVLAGHVVPLDPVAVEVVEDGQAGFGIAAILDLFPIIRLDPGRIEPGDSIMKF